MSMPTVLARNNDPELTCIEPDTYDDMQVESVSQCSQYSRSTQCLLTRFDLLLSPCFHTAFLHTGIIYHH
jgi:hypothetical protein